MNYAELQNRYSASGKLGGKRDHEEAPLVGKDGELPLLKVNPEASVYGAILFLPAISRMTEGYEWNRPAKLAIFLCILNAVLQMGVVRVIDVYDQANRLSDVRMLLHPEQVVPNGDNMIGETDKWAMDHTRETQAKIHRGFLPSHEKEELEDVDEITPLCTRIGNGNGTFTCMPQTVKYIYEWEHLDTNRDGLWTLEEASTDINELKKKRGVSPETIFYNMINGLRMQARFLRQSGSNYTLYLSSDVQKSLAIPKAYFDYWKGDAMMCGLFDANSCEAAAKQGVFEAALKPGRMSPRAKGIFDLDSAIQYCYRMLEDGGGCETLLPVEFRLNREQRWGRCGQRFLVEGGAYTNPYNPDQKVHVLEANYETVTRYTAAVSTLYNFFTILVICLWLLSLISELRDLIKLAEFLWTFPKVSEEEPGGDQTEDPHGTATYRITGIVSVHRIILVIVFIVRVLVFNVLTQFGTRFLLSETDYFNLVMNSLALTFILTIDGMLFALVEKDVKDQVDNCKPLEFPTHLPTEGWLGYFLQKECWGLILVPILSIFIVLHYNWQIKEPVWTVLRCACTQEGSKCLDSIQYNAGWWDNYWGKTLPAAIHQIEALRIKHNNFIVLGSR